MLISKKLIILHFTPIASSLQLSDHNFVRFIVSFKFYESSFFKILEEDTRPTPQGPKHPPSPFLIVANKILKGPVILNVGGKK